MSSTARTAEQRLHTVQLARPALTWRRAVLVPREHGAWGMFFFPLATGIAVAAVEGGHEWTNALLLVLACTAAFLLRPPVQALLGNGIVKTANAAERNVALRAIGVLGTIVAV